MTNIVMVAVRRFIGKSPFPAVRAATPPRALLTLCLIGLSFSNAIKTDVLLAQPPKKKQIEIYGGARRLNSPASPNTNFSAAKRGETPVAPPAPRRPLPAIALQEAAELEEHSTDSFRRGLLPLNDYLEHMRFVNMVEQRAAADRGDRRGVLRAAEQNVDRLREAAERLAALRQPAAENWLADTMLASAVTAEAEAQVAILQGNRDAADLANQRFQSYALQHLEAVVFDRRALGLTSLPTMAAAIALVATTDPSQEALEGVADFRNDVLLTTERWNLAGAGIGRDDEVLKAKVKSALDRGELSLISKEMAPFAADVTIAERAAQDLFDQQLEFYGKGTATLPDLTHAMLLRNRVHQLAASVDGLFTADMAQRWDRDLKQLVTLSQQIQDPRGRNAADILFVSLMNELDQVERTVPAGSSTPVPTPPSADPPQTNPPLPVPPGGIPESD